MGSWFRAAVIFFQKASPLAYAWPPAFFDNFDTTLHWILEHNHGATLLHYLDDFLLLGPPGSPTCQDSMSNMLQVCQELGMPVAMEKSEGPATCLTFLAGLLTTTAQATPDQAAGHNFPYQASTLTNHPSH